MDNKYYTPELEEFHIGFEYEVDSLYNKFSHKSFNKIIAIWEELDIVFDDYEHEDHFNEIYRVKYLDKEDIESLGWLESKEIENNFFLKDQYRRNWKLYLTKDIGRIILENDCNYFIDIVIKNKSELKKLLKQLNIK